jgi:ankyrin repeat protein
MFKAEKDEALRKWQVRYNLLKILTFDDLIKREFVYQNSFYDPRPTDNKTFLQVAMQERNVSLIEKLQKLFARLDNMNELVKACTNRDPTAFQKTKEFKEFCISFVDYKGDTALHYAASIPEQKFEVFKCLFAGADVNKTNKKLCTPLHYFISNIASKWNKNIENIINSFIAKGANLNCINLEGETPLGMAMFQGNLSLVALLLSKGADANQRFKAKHPTFGISFYSPLGYAFSKINIPLIRLLLKANANPNDQIYLDKNKIEPGEKNEAKKVKKKKEVEKKKEAEKENEKENEKEVTSHEIAKHLAMSSVVGVGSQKFSKEGTYVDDATLFDVYPLAVACQVGHLELVRLLCESGADVNVNKTQGVTPLFLAAQEGHAEIVSYLLEKGATPLTYRKLNALAMAFNVDTYECRDPEQLFDTPITIAFKFKHKEVIRSIFTWIKDKVNYTSEAIDEAYKILYPESNEDAETFSSDTKQASLLKGLGVFNASSPEEDKSVVLTAEKPTSRSHQKAEANLNAQIPNFDSFETTAPSTSSHRFLQDMGFSSKKIKEMKKQNGLFQEDKLAEVTDRNKEVVVPTWLNEKIISRIHNITPVQNGTNYHAYLDKTTLLAQGCDPSLFNNVHFRFCASEGEQGLKKCKPKKIRVEIEGEIYELYITYKMKFQGTGERILMAELSGDDKQHKLLVGLVYRKNNLHDRVWNSEKIYKLNLPEKLIETNQNQLTN